MFFSTVHSHWWIIIGVGLAVTFLPLLGDIGDFDADLDFDVDGAALEPVAAFLGFLGVGQVPLLFIVGQFCVWVGFGGWVVSTIALGVFGTLPTGFFGGLLTVAIYAIALFFGYFVTSLAAKLVRPLFRTTSADLDADRYFARLARVASDEVPRIGSGRVARAQMLDGAKDFVEVVLPQNAQSDAYYNQTVRVLERVTEFEAPIYYAVAKDSLDDEYSAA